MEVAADLKAKSVVRVGALDVELRKLPFYYGSSGYSYEDTEEKFTTQKKLGRNRRKGREDSGDSATTHT